MRSVKLLVAMAVLAAFVAGPVMAQSEAPAGGSMSSDQSSTSTTKSTTTTKKHTHKGKKHKKTGSGAAGSTTTGQ
jgi:hypothetical protein